MVSDIRKNIVLLTLIIFMAAGVFLYKSLAKELAGKETGMDNPRRFTSDPDQHIVGEYTDGSYTAFGSYISPSGPEEIEINLTLRNDLIEEIEFVPMGSSPTSTFFQEKFKEGFKDFVIGKNISEVKLDHVAGSSLTSIGFNEAIERIKSLAKS